MYFYLFFGHRKTIRTISLLRKNHLSAQDFSKGRLLNQNRAIGFFLL